MPDPVVPPVSQTLVDQAVQAGASLRVGEVTVKSITPDATNLIQPRTPRDIRPAPNQAAAAALAVARDRTRAAIKAAMAPPAAVDAPAGDPPPVDSDGTVVPAVMLEDKTVVPPVDAPPPPEVDKDPKAAHAWAKLRHDASEAVKAAEAAKAEAAARAADAAKLTESLAALQKERDDYQSKLEKSNLIESPAFKARYEGKINELRTSLLGAFSAVMEPEQAAALTEKAITSTPKEFGELLGKIPAQASWMGQQVMTTRAAVQQLVADREKAVTDWRATKVALADAEARDGRIRLATEIESETAKAVDNAVKSGNFMLTKNGDPKWDARVDELVTLAKTTLAQPRSRQDIIDLVAEGVSAKSTRDELGKVFRENVALKSQLAKLGMRPASTVIPAGGAPVVVQKPAAPVKMRDFVKDTMGKIGVR